MKFWTEGDKLIKYEKESSRLRIGTSKNNPLGSWTIKKEWVDDERINSFRYITQEKQYDIDKADAGNWFQELGGENKLVVQVNKWKITDRRKNE